MKGSEGGVREGYEGCVVLKEVLQTAFLFEIDGYFYLFIYLFIITVYYIVNVAVEI